MKPRALQAVYEFVLQVVGWLYILELDTMLKETSIYMLFSSLLVYVRFAFIRYGIEVS
jgi:hypothetical protein